MHRFRILGFYVAGLVAMVGLSIGAVSMRRTATEYGRRVSGTVSLTIPSKTVPDTWTNPANCRYKSSARCDEIPPPEHGWDSCCTKTCQRGAGQPKARVPTNLYPGWEGFIPQVGQRLRRSVMSTERHEADSSAC